MVSDEVITLVLTYEEVSALYRILEDWLHTTAVTVDGELEDMALKLRDRLAEIIEDREEPRIIDPPKLPWVIKR